MTQKIIILFIYLLTFTQIKAQNAFVKNKYNAFIEKQTIQWAAYATTNTTTLTPLFTNDLLQKIKSYKTKVYQITDDGSKEENDLKALSQNGVDSLFMNFEDKFIDSNGIEYKIYTENTTAKEILKGELKIHQILYVESGMLKSHITRISPLVEIILKSGIRLGKAEFFSTALSNNINSNFVNTPKTINLGSTTTLFKIDSLPFIHTLKSTFNNNILETLWGKIENGSAKIYINTSKTSTTIQQINEDNLMGLPVVNIPVYDEVGKHSKSKMFFIPINPFLFNKITIEQKWFYNETKNILLNNISQITIHLSEKMLQEAELKNENYLRIVF